MVRNFHRAHRARAAVTAHRAWLRGTTTRPRSGAVAKSARLRWCRNGREEPAHVRGQGQKPGGPYTRGAAAKRGYPASEVRGSSQECQAATAQEQPRGASHVRGQGQKPGGPYARGAAAKRSYPTSEVRGSGLECQAAKVQERPRGATPCPRSGEVAGRSYPLPEARGSGWDELPHSPRPGAAARRSNPTSKEWWLCGHRRA